MDQWRERYGKPVIVDEMVYKGNIQHSWGNITGEEMVRRFWECAIRVGYPGHGETYLNEQGIIWWSHGGILRGESWKRIGFLLDILKETPQNVGLCRGKAEFGDLCAIPDDPTIAKETGYKIYYYTFMRPSFCEFYFD